MGELGQETRESHVKQAGCQRPWMMATELHTGLAPPLAALALARVEPQSGLLSQWDSAQLQAGWPDSGKGCAQAGLSKDVME